MIIISVKIESSDFWSHSWLHYGAEMIRERILKHLFDMHVIIKDKRVMSDMLMVPNEILEQFFVNKSTSSSTNNNINRNDNYDDDDVVDVRLRLIPNPCGLLNHYDVYNNDWLLVGTGKPIECMRLIERVVWTNLIDIDSDIESPASDGDNKTSSCSDGDIKCSSSSGSDGYISNNIDGEIQYIDVSIDGSVSPSSSSSSSSLLPMLPSIPLSSILLPSSSKPTSLLQASSLLESESMDKSEHQSLTTTDHNNNDKDDDDNDNLYAKLYELRRCRPGYSMIGPCPVDMIEHPSVKGHHFYAMSVYFYALHCIKHYSPIPLLHW